MARIAKQPQAKSADEETAGKGAQVAAEEGRSGSLTTLSTAQASVIVGILSLLGGVLGSFVVGYFDLSKAELQSERERILADIENAGNSEVEKIKNDGVINAEKFRLQKDLVVKAIDKPSPKEVRDTLKFFAESGLIVDFEDRVRQYLAATPDDNLPFDSRLGNLKIDEYKTKVSRYRYLLDLIGRAETRGNYNAYVGAADNVSNPKFTEMKIRDVRKWQDEFVAKGGRISAVGKYLMIRATIDGLISSLMMTGDELFSADNQDILAVRLLEKRGAEAYVAGSMSKEAFALNVAKEWASMPVIVDTNGQSKFVLAGESYYSGNSAVISLISVEEIGKALDDILKFNQAEGQTTTP